MTHMNKKNDKILWLLILLYTHIFFINNIDAKEIKSVSQRLGASIYICIFNIKSG